MSSPSILVTGATGNIGRALVAELMQTPSSAEVVADAALMDDLPGLLGRPATAWADFVAEHSHVWQSAFTGESP